MTALSRRHKASDERGITLIEIMLSIIVVTAMIAGAGALYVQTKRNADLHALSDDALQLSRRLEETFMFDRSFTALWSPGSGGVELPETHPWADPQDGWAVGGAGHWIIFILHVPHDQCQQAAALLSRNFRVLTHSLLPGRPARASRRLQPLCAQPPAGEILLFALAPH